MLCHVGSWQKRDHKCALIASAIALLDMSCFRFRSRRQYEQPGIKEGAKVTSRARHRMSEARKGKTLSAGKRFNGVDLNNSAFKLMMSQVHAGQVLFLQSSCPVHSSYVLLAYPHVLSWGEVTQARRRPFCFLCVLVMSLLQKLR